MMTLSLLLLYLRPPTPSTPAKPNIVNPEPVKPTHSIL